MGSERNHGSQLDVVEPRRSRRDSGIEPEPGRHRDLMLGLGAEHDLRVRPVLRAQHAGCRRESSEQRDVCAPVDRLRGRRDFLRLDPAGQEVPRIRLHGDVLNPARIVRSR